MSEKRPKKAPKSPEICAMCTNTPKPSTGRILGCVAQNPIPRAPIPPATPHFLWFPSVRIAQRDAQTPVPVVTWWSRRAARPAYGGGQRWVHWVRGAKKMIFFKVVPRPLGMIKQVFLARFEPVVKRFGPWKIPKCLENGPFQDQKCVKNGSKAHFSKTDLGPFGMLKQVFLAHFEPVVTHVAPSKIPKCLENGPFQDQKWVKNGSKSHFSKSDPGSFGMLGLALLAHFEPVVTCFGQWKSQYSLKTDRFGSKCG